MQALQFLFGGGWSILWYLFFYALTFAAPVHSAKELLEYARKGGGPEGLGVFGYLMLQGVLLGFFSLIHSLIYVWRQPFGVGAKIGIVAAAVVGVPLVVVLTGIPLGEGKVWGFYFFNAVLVGLVVLNLWWLHAARAG